ncbi:hypothetical protein ACIQWA_36970 [Kitasatospora sp. NPDC098652]|uniref:hypothetical protein n=1 Tax=Kitasatospora sp. NPDC098652 TaxID=3364095 RepID=UPI00382BD811
MGIMNKAARTAWWDGLPAGIREQIDGYVLQDSLLGAVRVITSVGFLSHDIGVGTAQLIANDRYLHYGDRIAARRRAHSTWSRWRTGRPGMPAVSW